jgi:hypothetical protein
LSLDNPNVNLVAFVNVKGAIGTATSKRLILPGFFFQARGQQPFVNQEKRETPVDMQYGDRTIDLVTYHFPTGLSVEGTPQETKNSWKGHAVFGTVIRTAPDQIVVQRSLAVGFALAKPEEYQDLRDFYQKIAAADQQQIVLANTPAAKGN